MSYRTAVCFDYSQTEGEPLPELIHELTGDVSQYEDLLEAIRRISPVPIDFMAVPGQAYGYFSPSESKIVGPLRSKPKALPLSSPLLSVFLWKSTLFPMSLHGPAARVSKS